MSENATSTAVSEPDTDGVGLDRVMLAMDVVDTLRHQRALVEAELDDDRRQAEFVERVRAIYDSQGIEVPASVIEEGVRALREDRFVYEPPRRSFAVRLAEAYVDRRKWALRGVGALLLFAVVWASFAIPKHYQEQGWKANYARRAAALRADALDLASAYTTQIGLLERASQEETTPVTQRLLADAGDAVQSGRAQAEAIDPRLDALPAEDAYLAERDRWDQEVAALGSLLGDARAGVGVARGLLAAVTRLRSLQLRLDALLVQLADLDLSDREQAEIDAATQSVRAAIAAGDDKAGDRAVRAVNTLINDALLARKRAAATRARFAALRGALDGVDIDPEAARELASLHAAIGEALDADDMERASRKVAVLDDLVALLDQSYELRIVTRRGQRSGVWRYPKGDRSRRNHYVVVEAIGPDNKRLILPIESEETGSVRRVRTFAIRVPEEAYEQVKKDKTDNGIIDNALFGTKRRGAREPEYRFPVAGGRITDW